MNCRRFCVDETSFRTEALDQLAEALREFALLVERCRRDGQEVAKWPELWSVEVLPGLVLCEFLFGSNALDRDLRNLVGQTLGHCVDWEDGIEPDVHVAGLACDAHSIAYVHGCLRKRRAMACLILRVPSCRAGKHEVMAEGRCLGIHFIPSEQGLPAFYRDVFEIEDLGEDDYSRHASLAFPALAFAKALSFGKFEGKYRDLRPVVTKHLSVLNDDFQRVFLEGKGETGKIVASLGITTSKESPGTHKSSKAMRERMAETGEGRVCCEWHTKIEPHRDRIHFSPGSARIASGKVVVGIFVKHLET